MVLTVSESDQQFGAHGRHKELVAGIAAKQLAQVIWIGPDPGLAGIEVVEVPCPAGNWVTRMFRRLRLARELSRVCRAVGNKSAIRLLTFSEPGLLISSFARLPGVRRIHFIRADHLAASELLRQQTRNWLQHLRLRIAASNVRSLYRRARSRGTRFVVQTESFRQRLLALLGPDTDVAVVRNNCNRDSINEPRQVPSTRPRRLLLVSNIHTTGKGIDLAIAALAQLDPEYTLTIVGDGEDLHLLRSEHGSNDRLSFLGSVENASRLMPEYDMLVAPSRLDAYPNVVLEGLWHRIPIVASDIEGHRAILGEDFPLAPLTAAGLAQCIRRRAEDDEFNREILQLQELRRENHIFDWVAECARELSLP